MKKNVLVFAMLLMGFGSLFAVPAEQYLARISFGSEDQLYALSDRGVRIIARLDQGCLALLGADETARLGSEFAVQLLDPNPEEKLYLFVTSRAKLDLSSLAAYGDILLSFSDAGGSSRRDEVVLLRTSEDQIPELNRLPVELTRLSMEPMYIARDEEQPPVESRLFSDSLITEVVARVSQDSVLGTIRRLQNFYTRYSTQDSCFAAVTYMQNRLSAYGCDTVYGQTFRSNYAPNAIGIKWGKLNPRRIYIIDGHIDNTSDYEPTRCPGSDDNASGTTAALEACRVFADYEFDYTVKFIGFSGEEQGLYGSDSFSSLSYRAHDTILGVLNFDMISYGRTGYDGLIVAGQNRNPSCSSLVNTYTACADTYTSLTYTTHYYSPGGGYGSDHYYFWQRGYKAIWGEENDFTPKYHTIGDTIGTFNYTNCGTNNIPQCTEGIKAAVATLAKLAGLRRLTGAEEQKQAARRWDLEQCFPNPFADRTTIRYSAGPGVDAHISVYDRQGRLIRVLSGKGSGTGQNAVWDGLDAQGFRVVPGVYFYRLEGSRVSDFYKAIVVRN